MKVVIGVDHSTCSQAMLQWVKHATWPQDTHFLVVSAAPLVLGAYAMGEPTGFAAIETQQQDLQAHQELAVEAERALRLAGQVVESRVESADPRELIVRIAESEGAGLVVVGSHGRTGLPRLLMGSVASYVVSHAPCNVMVVKRPAAQPRSPDTTAGSPAKVAGERAGPFRPSARQPLQPPS